jgi:simple sugar transport system permease protein
VIVFLIVGMLVWVFLELTRHGRLMYAIGSNERAAASPAQMSTATRSPPT